MVGVVGEMASMERRKLWRTEEDGLCCSSSAIQTQLGPSSLLKEWSKTLISDPRRGCYIVLHVFIFFFPPLLSGPYLWNRYTQRLQIECAAWSCGLILHCCLPSNSLVFFFLPRFCPGHISGTVNCRDSKLSVLLGPAV